ncbi:Hypothetical predicted protein [Podarcis lilfordi]|uniref:Uncharacterized protein n=1 Tax=Podarcis lilfordi TaxID=74358 RepID=A0AA35PSF8_9SAUR|nr:Hypothetical predicted protein [Podarcis lilfordi]
MWTKDKRPFRRSVRCYAFFAVPLRKTPTCKHTRVSLSPVLGQSEACSEMLWEVSAEFPGTRLLKFFWFSEVTSPRHRLREGSGFSCQQCVSHKEAKDWITAFGQPTDVNNLI